MTGEIVDQFLRIHESILYVFQNIQVALILVLVYTGFYLFSSQIMLPKGLFRNYDIRGEYDAELTADAVYAIAQGYASFSGATRVVIARDARVSSPELKDAAVAGLTDSGVDVVDIGMGSTDLLYFATWHGQYEGGIMITASHMPGKYNGMKFLRLDDSGMLVPIGRGLGMEELEIAANNVGEKSEKKGSISEADIWDDFVTFVHSFVDSSQISGLSVVMDAGNGMGGVVAEKVFANMDIQMTKMFFEPDGTFPNHDPNPIIPENREDIIAKVKEVGADLGIAWDADCDRCYFIDENGEFVNGDFITTLLAIFFIKQHPGAGVVYDVRCTWAVRDWIEKLGGKAYVERVGHTFIKPRMRDTNSVFGGEMSAHYYFEKNKYMDNGFIPALIIMHMIVTSGKTLSELVSDLGDYYVSGEINFDVDDIQAKIKELEREYGQHGEVSKMDGLSVEMSDWHFNVRPSANDPVLRLNLEAKTKELLSEKLAELSEKIQS